MKSGWKVSTNYVSDMKFYQVYRVKDIEKTDEGGNREYVDKIFNSKAEAQEEAERLNRKDEEEFWKHD